jgi:predicted nucleic acid-binding protein
MAIIALSQISKPNIARTVCHSSQRAEAYGFIRAELEGRGEMVGSNDLWIAAHALASGLTLVTNNEREFRRVRGLKIQNWAV